MPNFIGSLAAKLSGTPVIYTGIRNAYLERCKLLLETFSCALASKVIVNNYLGEHLLNSYGIKNTIVIPNCYTNLHTNIPHRFAIRPTIVTVARFSKQKDFCTAINSIRFLKDSSIDFQYLIIGYGPEESHIRKLIYDFELEDNVRIIINPPNIFNYLLKSDIYLSTSVYEGTSNSIMEAMDAELPVVATDVGDNNLLIKNNYNGFIHNVGDSANIGQSLYRLVSSSDLRIKFGVRGKKILSDNYSFEQFKKSYIELIS